MSQLKAAVEQLLNIMSQCSFEPPEGMNPTDLENCVTNVRDLLGAEEDFQATETEGKVIQLFPERPTPASEGADDPEWGC